MCLVGLSMDGLTPELVDSDEMKAFLGHIAREQGHQFEDEVSEKLSQFGWRSKIRVELSRFGASAELGDFDLLAWNDVEQYYLPSNASD